MENKVSPLPDSLKKFKGKAKEFLPPVLPKTSLKKSLEKLQELAIEADCLIQLLHISITTATLHLDTTSQKRMPTASDLSSPIFGRDEECKSLIDILINEPYHDECFSSIGKKNIPILVVQGAVGIGKTVVAQGIYNDPRVEDHFNTRIGVHMLRNFDVYVVIREIIESVEKGNDRSSDIGIPGALKVKLEEMQNLKKFFLALDYVWCQDGREWDRLLGYLNQNGEVGSRILITTQVKEGALILGSKSVLSLKELEVQDCWAELEVQDCWSIVKHYAFGDQKKIIHDRELAEDFIEVVRRDESTLEEKGRDYLDELVSYSFFEKYYGYYRMHDLLHGLAEEVSKDQCLRIEK